LVGQRGAGGGYALARPVSEISLADIVEAVEGPFTMTMCSEGRTDCALDAHCRVKPHMGMVGDAIRDALGAVSLAQLSAPAEAGVQERDSAGSAAPWAPANGPHQSSTLMGEPHAGEREVRQ